MGHSPYRTALQHKGLVFFRVRTGQEDSANTRSLLRRSKAGSALIIKPNIYTTIMWQDYVNSLLGLCVIATAFLGFTGTTLSWMLVILGAAILIFALWSAGITSRSSEFKHGHA